MRASVAIVAGLALGAALGWWKLGHPGYETADQAQARAVRAEAAADAAKPRLYRWRDRNGVLQLTDTPPKGRKFEVVALREDVNVIPMSPLPEPEPETKAK